MLQLLRDNWGNILVAAIVSAAVIGALLSLRRKKKSGCTCGCGGCPSSEACHSKE